jgi:hypothetical protein
MGLEKWRCDIPCGTTQSYFGQLFKNKSSGNYNTYVQFIEFLPWGTFKHDIRRGLCGSNPSINQLHIFGCVACANKRKDKNEFTTITFS